MNVVTFFMMSVKMASPGLLKMEVFRNEGYEAIIFVHDLRKKNFSRDLNYIIDVVM